jgi:dihydroorotase
VPHGVSFQPLMTLYLKDSTTQEVIINAAQSPLIFGCKLYPAGVTTNSQAGVGKLSSLYPIFETMQKQQLPLLIHGEVNDHEVDVFDREQVFIDKHLQDIVKQFPGLKIVFEHITTKDAVDFVLSGPSTLAATITPQHLLYNRNALFVGGLRPHHYCLPVLKRKVHQQALINAATSGNPKFFIGTDSAPHAKSQKESACGCAGIFSHHAAIEIYAHIFEEANALDKLENFTSRFGADFYQLPYNHDKIILKKQSWIIPEEYPYLNEAIIPFLASQNINWQRVS